LHILSNKNREKISKELKYIITNCNEKKIEAHTHIQKMGNVFLNAQQMLAQLVAYIVLSIPLYHAFRNFKLSIHPHYKNVHLY
jgi:predicted nucleic acid binding AN1-type Zn finger protein